LAEEKKPTLEEEVAKHEFTKLVKEASNPTFQTNARKLAEDLYGLKTIHFYQKANKDGALSGKSPVEVAEALRKTEYKVSDEKEAEFLADELGVRTLKEVAGVQAKVYEDIVNKKKAGKELSKEELDALEFSREALQLYKVDWNSIKKRGLTKGFTNDVLKEFVEHAEEGTLNDKASRYLRQISDKSKMAEYLVKAAKVKSQIELDENKVRLKESDEMLHMIMEVNQAPDQFKEKYKDLIRKANP